MQGRAVIAASLLALVGVAGLPGVRAEVGGDPEFTSQERAQLAREELVERRTSVRRGDSLLIGGTSWQVIDASPEVVWQALLDTPHYPRMLPQVAAARVVKNQGNARLVFLRHRGLIVQPSYYIALRIDRPHHDITFRLDESRPHSVRAATGFYEVHAYGAHKTLLVYGVMADVGAGLLVAFARPSIHEWMMKVPWMVKRFVEGSGRYIYKEPAQPALADREPPASGLEPSE
jgi:hypothetical protein